MIVKSQKVLILGLVGFIAIIVALISFSLFRVKSQKAEPYTDAIQIIGDIHQLKPIADSGFEPSKKDWDEYVSVARNMRITSESILKKAFRELSQERLYRYDDEKMMLLLRISFRCPEGSRRGYVHGGFSSYSAEESGRTNRDMNWPLKRSLTGHFYLEDKISGYQGIPYDGEAELDWMLENCSWRDL